MQEFKTNEYPLTIIERHLDTFGHVNNATYLEIYEEARWDILNKGGYNLDYIRQSGKGPVILEVNLKFLKELRLHEKITVKTTIDSYEGKISRLHQWMEGPDGALHSEAIFTAALFDLKERKLILPTPQWLKALGLEE